MSRIIAGSCRGQRLVMPADSRTRPTTDRVREAAFNVIGSWADAPGDPGAMLAGLSFLDLFAGSAAVGLEAASRGAAPVTCVEVEPSVTQVARRNVATTGLAVRVVTASVRRFLDQPPQAYDIVWLDPPYDLGDDAVAEVLDRLVTGGWLAEGALVVVERSARTRPLAWPTGVGDRWERRYGETTLYFGLEGGA